VVEREQLESIWEEIKMLKVIEFAREKGREEGKEEGKEEGMYNILLSLLVKKFKRIPEEYQEKIKKLDQVTLNTLAMDIFEIKELKELDNYLT
jgi:predicted transposase YdaD